MNRNRILALLFVFILSITHLSYTGGNTVSELEISESEIMECDIKDASIDSSQTRSSRIDAKMSSWNDTFDNDTRIWESEFTTREDGYVMSSIIGDSHYPLGKIISYPIKSKGPCRWNQFNADFTKLDYKRVITIDNTQNSNALTGYAVTFKINTQTLISNGKMRTDCGDIRFYDLDGVELPYWIESGINTAATQIWVNVTSIPASDKTYIYMDYGHPSLVSKSSGKDTFDYFDSFDGAKGYDDSYWTASGVDANSVYSRSSVRAYDGSNSLRAGMSNGVMCSLGHSYLNSQFNKAVTVHFYDDTGMSPGDNGPVNLAGGKSGDNMRLRTTPSVYRYEYYDGSWHGFSTGISRSTGWHEFSFRCTTAYTALYIGTSEVATRSVTGYMGFTIAYNAAWMASITQYYDAYFVRPYYTPEPTVSIGPEPSGVVDIIFKIINATDDSEIMTVTDGQDLSSITEREIKLKAEFKSNGGGTVVLKEWGVDWNTLPTFVNIDPAVAKSVYRNQTVMLSVNATDLEELENDLLLSVEYKSPADFTWQTDYIAGPSYVTDHWKCTFAPPKTAVTGKYSFKISLIDSCMDATIYNSLEIEVLNNIPSRPEVSIQPENPKSSDDLTVAVGNVYDIETPASELELWYHWYRNDVFQITRQNISKVAAEFTMKTETWRCEVFVFDGEDASFPGTVEITLLNSPPQIKGKFLDLELDEDFEMSLNKKLTSVFSDPDGDALSFRAEGHKYIDIDIFQKDGTITFIPSKNWCGTERVTFYANDSYSETEISVNITVLPSNDRPKIIEIGGEKVIDESTELQFSVLQGDLLSLPITVEDADGDDKRGIIQFSIELPDTDNFYFVEEEPKLVFNPDNSDVGKYKIEIKLTDNNETIVSYSSYTINIYVVNKNDMPTVEITSPSNFQTFMESDKITFSCIADDIDLDITDSDEDLTIEWYSNYPQNTLLGKGAILSDVDLEPGMHIISVEVTDSGGETVTDSVTITVQEEESATESALSSLGVSPEEARYFWIAIALLIVIIVLVIVMAMLIRSKKRRVEKEEAVTPEVVSPAPPMPSPYTGVPMESALVQPVLATAPAPAAPTQPPAQLPPPAPAPPAPAQTYPDTAGVQQAGIDSSLSPKEKLKLLEERLLRGEIDQELYEHLKLKYDLEASQVEPQPPALLPPAQGTPQEQYIPQAPAQPAAPPVEQPPQVPTYPAQPAPPEPQPQPQPLVQSYGVQQPAAPPQQNICASCGQPLSFIEQNNAYYCYNCQRYA
ncbi:MAG: DUF2341 domain-containing protein [Thermoplasmata archaeon]|nr:MAG: DUF2341 domain-containing protein [Thermoplasmata archaeon]